MQTLLLYLYLEPACPHPVAVLLTAVYVVGCHPAGGAVPREVRVAGRGRARGHPRDAALRVPGQVEGVLAPALRVGAGRGAAPGTHHTVSIKNVYLVSIQERSSNSTVDKRILNRNLARIFGRALAYGSFYAKKPVLMHKLSFPWVCMLGAPRTSLFGAADLLPPPCGAP
eukprot:1880867-Pyramimonas_sp.AAC.2